MDFASLGHWLLRDATCKFLGALLALDAAPGWVLGCRAPALPLVLREARPRDKRCHCSASRAIHRRLWGASAVSLVLSGGQWL